MKILITGSAGYLGTLLTDYLISRNIPVVGIIYRKHPKTVQGKYLKFYSCDIRNKDYLIRIFNTEQPTHVVHFACSFNKIRNRKKEYSIDVGGSRNILEIANNTLSVMQLVYSSSGTVYGGYSNNPEWIAESHPLKPGKYRYGINKTVVEEMFSSTPVRDNLRILNLRICTVVGPSYNPDRNSLNVLVRSPILPRICINNKIQLLHEEDFISLMSDILHDDKIEGTYNMAPDSFASIRDLAPNKVYLNIPVSLISAVLWILWFLGLFNLQSVSVNIGIFPIVLDPSKLMTRFGYEFKHSTFDAYSKTVLRGQTGRRATNKINA